MVLLFVERFDDLYLEYEIESNGCCNPDDWSLWYDDADMDMLGDPGLAYNLCLPDFISRPISQNNYDLYPSCFSNSVDDCGVCDGFNLDMDCLGDCPSYTPNACTENYVGKVLFIKKGHRLSKQYHEKKDETIFTIKIVFQ